MWGMIVRWYRWTFNPVPMPAQLWVLTGVGRVHVDAVETTNHSCGKCEHDLFWHVHYTTYTGLVCVAPMGKFRAMAILWQPRTLKEVAEAGTPPVPPRAWRN